MKTTIDMPDALYKRVKIRAIERGTTLKQIVLASLERELEAVALSESTQPESVSSTAEAAAGVRPS